MNFNIAAPKLNGSSEMVSASHGVTQRRHPTPNLASPPATISIGSPNPVLPVSPNSNIVPSSMARDSYLSITISADERAAAVEGRTKTTLEANRN